MLADPPRLIAAAAFLPYLVLAAWDGWLHEKARTVPKVEQALHAALFFSVCAVVYGVFSGQPPWAWSGLLVFSVAGLLDEFGFHGALERRERRLHHAAYLCFAGFILVCWWVGMFPWPLP